MQYQEMESVHQSLWRNEACNNEKWSVHINLHPP